MNDQELNDRLARIENAVTTLAWWLVSAQTGFGTNDARGIEKLLVPPDRKGSQ